MRRIESRDQSSTWRRHKSRRNRGRKKMNTKLTKMLLGAALLFASASSSWALTPRQHAFRGGIESIDQDTRTLTVAPANEKTPLVFVWKGTTRFKQGRSRICSVALQKGAPVILHYRREIGLLVPREVNLRSEAKTPCAVGECCSKGS